ncbi:MAG: anaerobic ribonucleoside-triphosphate reductase activating protein [bacterium]|nr:anaerobic ribonucleoside-triphosphate reductase activating protein [bacterium]
MPNIRGLQPISFIEIAGAVSVVVFFGGCNFRCGYCQNWQLVLQQENLPLLPAELVLRVVKERKDWIDYVVLTGGEPTLDPELPWFLEELRKLGVRTALETNGSMPAILYELLRDQLVDYIAMDVKAVPEKYEQAIGVKYNIDKILLSIKIIKQLAPAYEFRVTAVPGIISLEDMDRLGELLRGSRLVCIQQFSAENGTLDPTFSRVKPYSREVLEEMAARLKKYVAKVKLRNI